MTKQETNRLSELRVLVPRGGAWGKVVAKALRTHGATPVISPLIDFAHTSEQDRLRETLSKLEAWYFDWVTATNPTIVDILSHHNIKIAKRTQLAVVGETAYIAFIDAGYEVARTTGDNRRLRPNHHRAAKSLARNQPRQCVAGAHTQI